MRADRRLRVPHFDLVLLDVNETLSDTAPLAERLVAAGLSTGALDLWVASTLRDGFASAAAGHYEDFSTLLEANLQALLDQAEDLREDPEPLGRELLETFQGLGVHADVPAGLQCLATTGLTAATLTNGDAGYAEALLRRAGLDGLVERHHSAAEVRRWKPAPQPYLQATAASGVRSDRAILVASHPWDVDGAKRAGLKGAWLNRSRAPYPPSFLDPDLTASGLDDLAAQLA
jgi:2-haloacid dehalogenase